MCGFLRVSLRFPGCGRGWGAELAPHAWRVPALNVEALQTAGRPLLPRSGRGDGRGGRPWSGYRSVWSVDGAVGCGGLLSRGVDAGC